MTTETATILENERQVRDGFTHKWRRISSWGMQGGTADFMAEWIFRRYGWNDADGYRAFLATRRCALDAGCGLGREAIRMAECGARRVVGIEIADCVTEAKAHALQRGFAHVQFIRANLMAAPFPPESFDYILSEGVLHHTHDTHAAFRALVRLLAPGGEVAFYVYRKKPPLREFADDHIRAQVSVMTPDDAWNALLPLTEFGRALARKGGKIEIPCDIPLIGLVAGTFDLQRWIYGSIFKCFWNDSMTFDENALVNFDWYYPRYAWRHTEDEVRSWVATEGLTIIHMHIEESGITMRCRRPERWSQRPV